MRHAPMLCRSVLLALTALSACAATTPPSGSAGDQQPGPGAYANFLVGQYAASQFDFPQAAASMREAMRDDRSALSGLAGETFLLELLAGNTGTASALATAVPNDPLAQLLLAGSAARAGRWHEALRRYQAMPTPDGLTTVIKPLLIGWALKGAGQTNDALAALQPLAGVANLRTIYALHIALIADQAGLIATAAQNYGIVQGGLSAPNLRLAAIIASWDARSGDKAGAARVLDSLNPDLALAMTVPALKASVGTAPVRTATDGLAESYVNLAAAFSDEQQTDTRPAAQVHRQQTVMILLQLALQLRPNLSPARLLLSDVMDNGHNAAVAMTPLMTITASDPLYPLAAMRRAVLLSRLGQEDDARALLRDLAAAYPWSAEPLLALGDLLRGDSHYIEAAAAYTEALPRLPANSPAQWLVYYDRGMSYDQGGNWKLAQPDLQQALKLSPGQPYVLNYLGYSWAVKKQNLLQARQMIEQALQAVPNDGAVVDSLGYVMLQQGDSHGAVTTLTKAVALAPNDPEINAHLGDAYAAAGEHLEASLQWRRALQLGPDATLNARLLAKLQQEQATAEPATSKN
ncbi:tetratricopeptide repeat protein [Acidisoma cladoniae]|jgi:tetratricopeptide (TPR) repeat protein|uniref:tetratricopeptide repeat protein n=1 Tax=Acidisoma cladoniae TaxID=3040935 RepID=UPI00254B4450|nr:tetratricopeptide repeat protein [Acidisoma sp. PAMC 29798]